MAGEWRIVPKVPQSLQIGANPYDDQSWKFVGRFTDAELEEIAKAWAEGLMAEAREQREFFKDER